MSVLAQSASQWSTGDTRTSQELHTLLFSRIDTSQASNYKNSCAKRLGLVTILKVTVRALSSSWFANSLWSAQVLLVLGFFQYLFCLIKWEAGNVFAVFKLRHFCPFWGYGVLFVQARRMEATSTPECSCAIMPARSIKAEKWTRSGTNWGENLKFKGPLFCHVA